MAREPMDGGRAGKTLAASASAQGEAVGYSAALSMR